MGLADRGGWREEAIRRPEIQASFLYPLSYAPLGEWGHISGEFLGLFLGVCLSPTPSRQPLPENLGLIERGVPKMRSGTSGATVRLGHVLRGFIYSTIETRHFDTYPNWF